MISQLAASIKMSKQRNVLTQLDTLFRPDSDDLTLTAQQTSGVGQIGYGANSCLLEEMPRFAC